MVGRPPHRCLISNLFQPLPRKLWPLRAPSNQPCLLGCSEPAVEPIQGGDPPIRSKAGLRQQGTGFLIQQKSDHGGQQASTPRRRHTACPVLQVDFRSELSRRRKGGAVECIDRMFARVSALTCHQRHNQILGRCDERRWARSPHPSCVGRPAVQCPAKVRLEGHDHTPRAADRIVVGTRAGGILGTCRRILIKRAAAVSTTQSGSAIGRHKPKGGGRLTEWTEMAQWQAVSVTKANRRIHPMTTQVRMSAGGVIFAQAEIAPPRSQNIGITLGSVGRIQNAPVPGVPMPRPGRVGRLQSKDRKTIDWKPGCRGKRSDFLVSRPVIQTVHSRHGFCIVTRRGQDTPQGTAVEFVPAGDPRQP